MKILPLAIMAALEAASISTPVWPATALTRLEEGATVQPAAFDGSSDGGRRGGRRSQGAASTKADEPAKPVPPETAEQHRAYLKRYGFGQ